MSNDHMTPLTRVYRMCASLSLDLFSPKIFSPDPSMAPAQDDTLFQSGRPGLNINLFSLLKNEEYREPLFGRHYIVLYDSLPCFFAVVRASIGQSALLPF